MKKTYQLVAIVACALAICSCEKQGPSVISSFEVTPLENSAVASMLRVNNELTRKSILAPNLSDMVPGTLEVNGHDYAIRNYGGVVDMVFTQYYTRYND